MSPSRSLAAAPILLLAVTLLPACASARPSGGGNPASPMPAEAWFDSPPKHSAGEIVLLYIPNRLFDLLDIVRARVRVGPGFAFSVRATEGAQFTAGTYSTLFLGLPGPRRQRIINWPVGVEKIEHAQGEPRPRDDAPRYGIGEIGLGLQAAIVGADVGVDPWEIVDFLAGIITLDPVEDDL